jgi:hypothetical protein
MAAVRRLSSRACFAAAAIATAAALFPTGVNAQTVGTRPRIFSTASDATGVEYFPDQEGGLTPIKDTFRAQFVTSTSTMSATNGPTARATVVDPGNGATQGPANACPAVPGAESGVAGGFSAGGAAFIGDPMQQAFDASNDELKPIFDACTTAKWPFAAQADSFTPDKRTEGAIVFGEPNGQLYGDGGGAHAVINDDGTSSADAQMSGLRIAPVPGGGVTGLPLPPAVPALPGQAPGAPVDTAVFTVGSIQSTTANFFDGPAAVSHSESRLNGVRLVGGLVTIDSIASIAESRFESGADPIGASSTTVQGVKFLGQHATIDDKGIHPDGNPDGGTQALRDAGLSVRLVGATQGIDDRGFMTAASQGVVVDFIRDVNTGLILPSPPPNPVGVETSPSLDGTYFVRYFLASVATRSFARNLKPSSAPSGSPRIPSFSTNPPTGAERPSGFTGATKVAPAALTTDGPDAGAAGIPVFFGLTFDLRWLYLAFTLAAFGMCLAPRLLPARLPGRIKA